MSHSRRSRVPTVFVSLALLFASAFGCRERSATGVASGSSAAQPVAGPWSRILVGVEHTCGTAHAGGFYCWGQNWFGQYGNGTTVSSDVPAAGAAGFVPASYVVGYDFTCALTPSGEAFCWGCNQTGALGNGFWDPNALNPISHPNPVRVAGGLTFASLSAGYYHVCGVTTAGAAYCWGDNSTGEDGDGITARVRVTPDPVLGSLSFATLAAATFHTCGLTGDGLAYCWGGGSLIGDGTSLPRLSPAAVLAGRLRFVSITAGTTHSCALTAEGAAYCWGLNQWGELGDSTTEQRYAPVAVHGGLQFARLSAGEDHTCGVTTAGAAYCWGRNNGGQLGVGDTLPRAVPVRVHGELLLAGIVARVWGTCAWSAAGGAFCWGFGAGTEPVPVQGP